MSANVLRPNPSATSRTTARRKPARSARLRVESLELRDVPAATLALDFNTNASPTPAGFTGVKPVAYSAAAGHGWQSLTGVGAMDRATANALTRDFQHATDATFLADLPNGTYNVTLGLGDPGAVRDRVSVWAEGQLLAANVKTNSGQVLEVRGRVTVVDGQLTVRLADGGGQNTKFALNYLTARADDPNATGLFPADDTPAGNGSLGTRGAEVGLRFRADTAGFITGIRFYKGAGNTGTHVGSLWDANGTRLASATFTNETAGGWQEVRFASPVAVQANTTYVASYWAPTGKYSLNLDYFAVSGLTSGHLVVLPGPQGGGGVYARGGGFPTNTNRSSNYWVDVVFAADSAAPTVTGVVPANNATNVSPSAVVTVAFSEPMDPATVNGDTVLLQAPGGATVPATVTYDDPTRQATLTPGAALTAGTTYTVVVKGGNPATSVQDLTGAALAADFTSTFTTATGGVNLGADAGPDQSANEGAAVSFSGSATGGSGTRTYSWDFGDGTAPVTGTLTPTHTYADNGSYTVRLTVTDGLGTTVTDPAVVTVANVAPTGSISNSGPVNTGASVTISIGGGTDASAADVAAGFKYSFDFDNNGTWDVVDSTTASAATSFATAGSKTVRGRIKDKDGGFTDYTTTVVVNNPGDTGLVAYFPFDEGTGTTINSSTGGLTGTISGATWSAAGQTGGALSFDGVNDWVTVADANALDLTTGMTLEAWVRPTAINGWESVLLKEDGTDSTYSLYADNNGEDTGAPRRPAAYIRQGSTYYSTTGSAQLAVNTWTHLAATYDGTALRFYVNGALTNSLNRSGSINTSAGVLRIGGNSMWGEYFNGLIDDVRVYNRALSAAEIQADMNLAPTVTAVTPADGTTGVLTTTAVTVTFSEPMDAATITSSSVLLRTAGGSAVAATVAYDAANRRATLTPSAALTQGATYTVVVKGGTGADAVKDTFGKPMAADFTSTFATTDGSPPVADAGPDKTGNEGASISFTGSSTGGTGQKTYTWDFGDGTPAVTGTNPAHTYADNGTYTVTLTVTDQANASDTDTGVVTVANVAPTGTLSNSGPVAPGASVTISFSGQADASSADTAAGLRYSFDLDNDGTWDAPINTTTSSVTTSFATVGSYVVRGRVMDKDGGATIYNTTVQVTSGSGYQGILRTLYVSPTGSDTNDGSAAAPWATLQKAAGTAVPGDMIVVRAGTYAGFQMTRSGTAANPIVFKADPGVLLDRKSSQTPSSAGVINLEGASYIAIDGFQFKQATYGNANSNIRSVVNTGVIIRNNTIDFSSWWGIFTGFSEDILIENNRITDTQISHGIYVSNSADDPVIRNNYISGSAKCGLQINADASLGGDGIISRALVENNTLIGNARSSSASMNLDGVYDSIIRNNVIYGQRNAITLYQIDGMTGSRNNQVVGNTIVMAPGTAYYAVQITDGSTGNRVLNNILWRAAHAEYGSIGIDASSRTGFVSDYNVVVDRFNLDPAGNQAVTLAQWQAQTGQDAHSIQATPDQLFVDWANMDFRLRAGSPAANAGLDMAALPTDITGVTRPTGGRTDIGAYESF